MSSSSPSHTAAPISLARVLRNSSVMVAQQILVNLITIFVIGYIARKLGATDYGVFTLAFTYVSIFKIFTGMGLRSIAVREVARAKSQGSVIASQIAGLRLLLSVAATAAALAILLLMGYPLDTRIAVFLALPTLALEVIATAAKDVFQAFEQMEYIAVVDLAVRLATAAGSVAILLAGGGLYSVVAAYSLGSFIAAGMGLIICRRRFFPLSAIWAATEWGPQLRAGLPFALIGLLSSLYINIDVLLLSKLTDSAAVGMYNAAMHLVYRATFLADALATAAFPALAASYDNDRGRAELVLRKLTFLALLLGIPAAVAGTVGAPLIIRLIFGPEYQPAIPVFRAGVWVVPLMFLTVLLNYALGAIHRQHQVAVISGLCLVTNVGLNLFMIPQFREMGAAVSTVITELVALIMFVTLARRGFHRVFDSRRTIRLLSVSVFIGAAGIFAAQLHPLAGIILVSVLYGIGLPLCRIATIADIRKLVRREII